MSYEIEIEVSLDLVGLDTQWQAEAAADPLEAANHVRDVLAEVEIGGLDDEVDVDRSCPPPDGAGSDGAAAAGLQASGLRSMAPDAEDSDGKGRRARGLGEECPTNLDFDVEDRVADGDGFAEVGPIPIGAPQLSAYVGGESPQRRVALMVSSVGIVGVSAAARVRAA